MKYQDQEYAVDQEVLPGFEPVNSLWEGPRALFPSADSARWALHRQRAALIEANALALHRGRIFIRRDQFIKALQASAVDAYRQRYPEAAA